MYYNIELNKQLISSNQLRKEYPNTSFPKIITDKMMEEYGYTKVVDNRPTLTEYQRISSQEVQVVDGVPTMVYTIEDLSQEEILSIKISNFTKLIDNFIQDKIDEYNTANGVMFADINSIFKYTADTTYTHYDFCMAITLWNIQVWEYVRQLQADVLSGTRTEPTEEELIAELPVLSY